MPENLADGSNRSLEDSDEWLQAFLQSPTPPWCADTASLQVSPSNNRIANTTSHNQYPTPHHGSANSNEILGINTPPVSSSTSSQCHHGNRNDRQYNTQESSSFPSANNQGDGNSYLASSAYEHSEFAVQWCEPPGPAHIEHHTHFSGLWQSSWPEEDAKNSFPESINHPETEFYVVRQADYGTESNPECGFTVPQGVVGVLRPTLNEDSYYGPSRDAGPSTAFPTFLSEDPHLVDDNRPPRKKPRVSTPSPTKMKKTMSPKTVTRGSVPQHIFATHDHVSRSAYAPERLEEVNLTRKTGACVCCSWTKKTCKMDDCTQTVGEHPCQGCLRRMARMSVSNPGQICFVLHIDNIRMFRPHSPLHKRPATEPIDFILGTTEIIEIRLTGSLRSTPIKLKCLEFVPHEDDVVVKIHGVSQQIAIRPYAIADLDGYKEALFPMLTDLTETFLKDLEQTGSSQTVIRTLRAAIKYRDKHPTSLVAKALRVWVYTKLCGTEKALVGKQLLGVAPVQEEGVDLEGIVPVPPKIDHQTDTIMINLMKNDAPSLVKELKHLIDKRNKQDWYQIFLTVFIILNNVEFLLRRQGFFLEDWNNYYTKLSSIIQSSIDHDKDRDRARRCIQGSKTLISEFKESANQILCIYRLYAGTTQAPFAKKRTLKDLKDAALLPNEIEYVASMFKDRELINSQRRDEHHIKDHDFEMVWAAQLFQQLD